MKLCWNLSQYATAEGLQRDLARVAKLGARGRLDFVWGYIDNGLGTYNWSQQDAKVSAFGRAGIEILGVIPMWTPPGKFRLKDNEKWQNHDPAAVSSYLRFVQACVERYPNVVAWERSNEPNITTFAADGADPEFDAAVCISTATTIRSANPHALVLSPGLASAADGNGNLSPLTWTRRWWPIAGGSVDRMGMHSYADVESIGQNWSALTVMPQLFSIGKKKIWLTEVNSFGTDADAARATAVPKILDHYRFHEHIERAYIYEMSEQPGETTHYGCFDDAGHERPLYSAINTWALANHASTK